MGRRANSEGSIYKRGDGKWCAAITMPNGKQKVAYAKTQDEARRKLAELVKLRDQGLLIGTERQTVAQYLSDWLENAAKPAVRPKTYDAYRLYLNRHIIPTLGTHQLAKLTPQHVQAFLTGRLAAGLAPKSVRHLHAMLRRALNQAVRWGLVPRNVAALVEPPKAARFEVTPLAAEDARRLLDTVRGDRLEALYVLTLSCGLRAGEVLGLTGRTWTWSGARRASARLSSGREGSSAWSNPRRRTAAA